MKLQIAIILTLFTAAAYCTQSNLEYWIKNASTPENPASRPSAQTQPQPPIPPDALPALLELSDGQKITGWAYGTHHKQFSVFVESEKRWRRVPLAACLRIHPSKISQELEAQWRWKEMGSPEKVLTGKSYITRRFIWTFTLIDGTEITGTVKGQPLWINSPDGQKGPFIFHERQKGNAGQPEDEVVYIKKLVISKEVIPQ